MTYIGIDLHRDFFVACIQNEQGEVVSKERYENSIESIGAM